MAGPFQNKMSTQHIHLDLPFTYGAIALIILVYFGMMGNPTIANNLHFSSYLIRKKHQYYRLLSPALVHAGVVHLLMNCVGIYFFGPVIEQSLGAFLASVIFILSVAGGSLVSLWLRRQDIDYQAVGASGGVSGIIMAGIFIYPDMQLGLMLFPVLIPAWIFGIIYSLGSIVLTQTPDRNRISHEGHLGGLLFGGIVAYAVIPSEFLGSQQEYVWYFGIIPIIVFMVLQGIFPKYFYKKG